jgi:hypothetical protein
MLFVQLTPSSQSACSQHSAQSPPAQHFSLPAHMGGASHMPSALQRSLVQASLSLQSSGPPQGTPVPAAFPTLPLPPAAEPPLPPSPSRSALSKTGPEQALIKNDGSSAQQTTKSAYLGLKLTTDLLCKISMTSIAALADALQKA